MAGVLCICIFLFLEWGRSEILNHKLSLSLLVYVLNLHDAIKNCPSLFPGIMCQFQDFDIVSSINPAEVSTISFQIGKQGVREATLSSA